MKNRISIFHMLAFRNNRHTTALFVILIALCLPAANLICQEEGLQWIPLNVPQLSQSEVQYLDALTSRIDSASYSQAVGFIEQQVLGGLVSSGDRVAVELLNRVISSPWSRQYVGDSPDPAMVPVRQRAVSILGFIGGDYSLQVVDEIIIQEDDSIVLAQVFQVYREIAPPFNEHRNAHFARILRRATIVNSDEPLCRSVLSAIESMHLRTFSMNSEPLFMEILGVINSSLSLSTRQQALDLARVIAGVEIDVD